MSRRKTRTMGRALRTGDFFGASRAVRRAGAFVLGQWTAYSPGHHVKPHGHAEAHFMYVPAGVTYESCARGTKIATGANLIYNPPQTWHRDRVLDHGRFLAVTIVGEPAHLHKPCGAPAQIGNPTAHAIVARIIRDFAGDELHLESLCFELLDAVEKTTADEPVLPSWMRNAIALLNDCRQHDHTIAAIAAEVGVHPVHLARGFRRFCGSTPGQYLLSLRLDRAARLLGLGRLSLAEIALATGFADQSHFTKQFRRFFTVPPGEYRRLTAP